MNNDIRTSAMLNEEIKAMLALSRTVYLSSLNAMLLARRAGSEARGYVEVTGHLRRFAQELSKVLQQLRREVDAIVDAATALRSLSFRARLARRALREAGRSAVRRETLEGRLERAGRQRRLQLMEARRTALATARRALQLCHGGTGLTTLGKIEAAQSGGLGERLHAVAEELEAAVTAIQQRLDRVDGELAAEERAEAA